MDNEKKELSLIMEIPIVRFLIGTVNFGLDVFQVRDIVRRSKITRVPNGPDHILGVINLRGQIIPVINLRKRLSFNNFNYKEDIRILIVEIGNEITGLMVDSVSEVKLISSNNIMPRPRYLVNNIDSNYLIGLGTISKDEKSVSKRMDISQTQKNKFSDFILLLDLAKVLDLPVKFKNRSVLNKIIERKIGLITTEREKLKERFSKTKSQEKKKLMESYNASITRASSLQKKEKFFKERQREIIDRIKNLQGTSLQMDISKISLENKKKNLQSITNTLENQKTQNDELEKEIYNKLDYTKKKKKIKRVKKVKKVIVKKKTKSGKSKPTKKKNVQIGKIKISDVVIDENIKGNNTFENLSELELSLIQEIGNIGAGNSATALSTMIDKRIDISVPIIKVVPIEQLARQLGGSESLAIATYLEVEGDISMHMMLIFGRESGLRLVDLLLFQKRSEEELKAVKSLEQMDESALMEVGNILSCHYLTALSEFTGLQMIPGPPLLTFDMLGSIVDFIQIELEEKVDTTLILNTDIIVENQKIEGYILLLPIPETILDLLRSMGL